MDLYDIKLEYLKYLYQYDKRVPISTLDKSNRPFIGVLIFANYKNYFAPLTSPKEKHIIMKDTYDFMRIDKGKYGAINFNNMIPIPNKYLYRINALNIQDEKYIKVIKNQLMWINNNKKEIKNKAKRLYYLINENKATDNLKNRCCNFKLLEIKYTELICKGGIEGIMEEEELYILI